jgi:N-dimethylarginine dimethylaminohydrolase
MKNIFMISPHKEEFYSNNPIESNNDLEWKNTAVKVWQKCNLELAIFEYKNLVNNLLQLDINLINTKFPWKELSVLTKNKEYLNSKLWKYIKDNIVFSRDWFISNRNNKIILSKFRNSSRKFENKIINELLIKILKENNINREIIYIDSYLEWGDFRYLEKDNILFAWYNRDWKSSRNSREWINYVKNEFNIKNENFLIIESKWFHLDTVFSTITNKEWNLLWGLISYNNVNNLEEIDKFFKDKGLFLLKISDKYAINWNWYINTLSINDVLLSSWSFDESVEEFLENKWIKRLITSTKQFWKVGWWPHCLTNEI